MEHRSKFITTEIIGKKGETGEKLVWDAMQTAFASRTCLGYWRYPIFNPQDKFRQEPDILLLDYLLGVIVIEVKAITSEQIVAISGHRWQYQNFYTDYGNPYQQAENQLFALLEYTNREPLLKDAVAARAAIALPYITAQQWQQRGFHKLPNSPPILFKDCLATPKQITQLIEQTARIKQGARLTSTQWELLLATIAGTPIYIQPHRKITTDRISRSQVIQQAHRRLHQLDLQQEQIAKQIPPGMQRIRGVAGSGKTVLLCQKAAIAHIKHPEWLIALVFFSRSLYDRITQQVDLWIRHFSNHSQTYDPQQSNLKILHAWGSRQQPGFYSTLCKLAGIPPLSVAQTESQQPNEALAEACMNLLESVSIPQVFDAVLIDEGQDLVVDRWLYQHKQPFYWLAYQSLRPVNPVHPEQRRLIWTYDELQSLASLTIPNTCELFGEELGHLVTGKYAQQINKTEIIACGYRTPQPIMVATHAIAMGLLSKEGMLTGSIYPEEWQAIGYQVQGKLQPGEQITLYRDRSYSPNLLQDLWQGNLLEFQRFSSRQQELTVLADNIKYNLQTDGLQAAEEILIIVLGSFYDAAFLEKQVAKFLMKQGINIYLPTNDAENTLHTAPERRLPNQFWYEGAITISTIHRAKGQEADVVYLVGLDRIAKQENDIYLRNQLYVALTRTRGWVYLSGIGNYALYQELEQVIASGDRIEFTFTGMPQRELKIGDRSELLQGYALGRRNFRYADLAHTNLAGMQLKNINLIDANLSGANLRGANLSGAKLIAADLSYADLTNANLSKAKLIGANLNHAKLTNTNLERADLTNTILSEDV